MITKATYMYVRKLTNDIINIFMVNAVTRKYVMSLHIGVIGWSALWYANRSQLTAVFCR